jgi:scavenger receptor class B, member 1
MLLLSFFLQSIAQVAAEKSFFLRLPINMVIRNTNSQPIVQQTAKEFMFGYKSKLSTLGNTLLPDWIYFDKVGLIDRVSDDDDDDDDRKEFRMDCDT